jgi:hypothetical protein
MTPDLEESAQTEPQARPKSAIDAFGFVNEWMISDIEMVATSA